MGRAMRHRLTIWWHRRIRGHTIGATVHLAELPSPWVQVPEFVLGDIWATRCAEEDCFWVHVEYASREPVGIP